MSSIPPVGSVPDVVTNTVIASDWGNAVGSASRGRVVHRFNTTTERDSSITAPVAGMVCYVVATNTFYGYRNPGGWSGFLGGPRDTTHARVYQNGAWNTFTGSPQQMSFDTVDFDPVGMWSVPNRRFTVPSAGVYLLTALVSCQYVAANLPEIQGWHNGGAFCGGANPYTGPYVRARAMLTSVVKCNAGDTLSVAHFSNPGSNAGTTGPAETFAACDYLGTG